MKKILFIISICFFSCTVLFSQELNAPFIKDVKIVFVSYRTGTADLFMMNSDGSDLQQITNSKEDNRFPVQIDQNTIGFTKIDSLRNFKKYQVDIHTGIEKKQEVDPIVPGADWENIDSSGRYIAYYKSIQGVNELYIYDTLEKYEKQITRNLKNNIVAHSVNHTWSPDGKQIAFMSGPDWYHQFIRVYDLEKDIIRTVTKRGYMNSGLLWLKDNSTLLANLKIRNETLYDLYHVSSENGQVRQITKGINLHPNISPDGNWIVFESQRHGNDGEVYIMRPDGTNQIRLTNNPNYNGRCIWFRLK